jgi:Protein of unknown function (DUF3102)
VSKQKANMAVSGQQKNGASMDRRNRTLEVIKDELHGARKTQLAGIINTGELLLEAKEHVGHGVWLPFLKELSMSPRSAQRYMKAYEFVSAKNVTVANLKLSPTALYLLSEDDYWGDGYAREAATHAVLKEAATQWVGSDRAIEVIEQTRAKQRACEEAMARAMCDEMEAAERQAVEDGKRWEDIETDWKQRWTDDNWGDERQAEFEAEWERAREQKKTADGDQGALPTIDHETETAAITIAPEQAPKPEEDPTKSVIGTSSKQAQSTRSGFSRHDDKRPCGAAAADRDTCRSAAMVQVKNGIDELMGSLAAPCFDDFDRRTIRNQHEPYLDGFIDEEGELRFEPAQVPPLSSAEAQAERSIEDCEAVEGGKPTRRRDRIAGKAKAPADVAGTS